ncbi:unnamed protein product [Leptosia nina]|uniref:Connectin n=1 Tax=Leptosia nina TaxID=320188 RepID=A0AAV1J2G4_9NEOP
MRAQNIPVAVLLLLITIHSLQANGRIVSDQATPNVCDIGERSPNIHCYCEDSNGINDALKIECWIFNGGIEKTDPLWSIFTLQRNIEKLGFNVRADGALAFVPTTILELLKKLKDFSIKHSSISTIESYTFMNITSIQTMIITKNQISLVVNRHAFYNLPNLTVLTLDDNNIKTIETDTFYELPKLQKLFLTGNNITIIEDGAFRHLVNLSVLELDKNNISDLKKECFDGLANLNRLDLRENKIIKIYSFTFTELWNLEELLLDHNEIYVLERRAFDGLSLLKKLSLNYNKLVTIVEGLFEGVRGLSILDLSNNKLKRFTFENLSPLYDNIKLERGYISLEGNDFDCDCHLAWMYKLHNEASSIKVKTSLEQFVCKFNSDFSNSQFPFYQRIDIKNNLGRDKCKKDPEDFHDEIDDNDLDESRKVGDSKRTLLQIPVELLPCPNEVRSVTGRTYTYPSQNEAKDYRKVKTTSSISSTGIRISFLILFFPSGLLLR